jgi:hypothetical protein
MQIFIWFYASMSKSEDIIFTMLREGEEIQCKKKYDEITPSKTV